MLKEYIIGFFGGIFSGLVIIILDEFRKSGVCFSNFDLIACIFSGIINVVFIVVFFFIGWGCIYFILKKRNSPRK